MYQDYIRNFCIIAHIDHGKSTLADRFLEFTHTIEQRDLKEQVLDSMDLERERGITIKSHAIRMLYKAVDKNQYIFNLIDTPGHVDFSYEVSRSLAACEGALLVVDAAQGVEAQTISNLYLAIENDLTVIPVINKIDLPSAQVEVVKNQILELLGCEEEEIKLVSAKSGKGVEDVLETIVKQIPPPKGDSNGRLQALIFDSVFDSYRGAISFIRIYNGTLRKNDAIKFFSTGHDFLADEIGTLRLTRQPVNELRAGEVGYLISGAKNVQDTKVGDTVTHLKSPAIQPLPGYREVKPMVFSGIYPVSSEEFEDLREALEKLALNDSALTYEPETSKALGFGFRCGFLGLLHMEIVQERLEREYNLTIINTVPNVIYRVHLTNGDVINIDNPTAMPNPGKILMIEEPYIIAQIITPPEYIGAIMRLGQEKRAIFKTTSYIDPSRADMQFSFPLSEVIFDFYDKLKSQTRGYASFDYDFDTYRESKLVKLDIMINSEPLDALSTIIHMDKSYDMGQRLCRHLKELIPRQMFEVVIQASIGSKIISRQTVKALRKNVTAKCYGGDITRKRKLLEKQKEGKKRMKQVGRVDIPQEAFLAVLSMDKND
ncbi:MAG: elongation factor 4 [Calditrichaceae bacterium]|nr:elongation factor 4 [Calditrichaceae bacterium]MBN2707744.1 elongation factor 4 [Calditrichaceae bacterium]RQV96379.1 MAG: elongation factor 4 [Calditrichota bacterium]